MNVRTGRDAMLAAAVVVMLSLKLTQAATAEERIKYDASETVSVPVEEFVPKDLISGPGYALQAQAIIRRSVALYRLDTDYGKTEVVGTVNLLQRIAELRAIDTLEAMKRTEVYTDALKNSAKAPIETAKGLVTDPVDTVSGAVRGLGSFLADVGYSIVSDDPSQDNVAKTALGFAAAKRQLAYGLGVNPYSTFEPLQEQLSEVAWTAVGGGLTVSAAFRAVENTPGAVLRVSKTTNSARQLVRDNSPRKLQNRNLETLQAMGVSEELGESLLNNFNYDPEAETRLVTALASMDKVDGRADVVARAALVTTPQQASIMRDWVELIAAYHAIVAPARRLVIISTAPFIVDGEGALHGVLPADYVTWTPGVEARIEGLAAQARAAGFSLGSLLATGKVDPKMAELARAAGWAAVQGHAERVLRTE